MTEYDNTPSPSTTPIAELIERALGLESRVRVEKGSKSYVGTLTRADDGKLKVVTGKQGRPAVMSDSDVTGITEEGVVPQVEGTNDKNNVVIPDEEPGGDQPDTWSDLQRDTQRLDTDGAPSFDS